MYDLIWLIPLLPLLGFLANVFVIRDEQRAGYVASGAVILAFVVALATFIQFLVAPPATEPPRVNFILWEWISLGAFRVPFGLLFDPLSAVMILLVTGVGALIHVYSIGYMHGDPRAVRYFAYLNLFVTMMLMLVMADNLLLLFLGWEGVGLCSFLLIGFWFERKVASEAAVKAFIVNRIGDAAMLLAMLAVFANFGTLSFYDAVIGGVELPGFIERVDQIAGQFFSIPGQNFLIGTGISFLLLIAATGKSAQIPLFVWLPDAMAGPTPVSALIHAATMVTGGVYLIVRTHPIFTPSTLAWVTWIGAFTALIAATAAIAQWDIKRVLAYSTVSQLGFMVAAAGMGAWVAAIFHLLTHGVFKALLFLGSGSVIHGTHDTQDMRRMGGLREHMPTTFRTYLIGAAALAGIFPFAGFWSKDEILAHAWTHQQIPVFFILLFASMLTAFYMGRQIALVFYGKQRDPNYHAHESGRVMTVPLIILAVGATIAGLMNLPGSYFGAHLLNNWLEPVLNEEAGAFTVTKFVIAVVAFLLALASAYAGWRYYVDRALSVKVGGKDPLYRGMGDIWDALAEAWYFDRIYEKVVVIPGFRALSRFLADIFDPEGVDGLVRGVGQSFGWAATGIRRLQNGLVRSYALIFLAGVVLIVGYFVMLR